MADISRWVLRSLGLKLLEDLHLDWLEILKVDPLVLSSEVHEATASKVLDTVVLHATHVSSISDDVVANVGVAVIHLLVVGVFV